MILPNKTLNHFKHIPCATWALIVAFTRFIVSLVGLLAEGARESTGSRLAMPHKARPNR